MLDAVATSPVDPDPDGCIQVGTRARARAAAAGPGCARPPVRITVGDGRHSGDRIIELGTTTGEDGGALDDESQQSKIRAIDFGGDTISTTAATRRGDTSPPRSAGPSGKKTRGGPRA